jgi:adenosine deaminase
MTAAGTALTVEWLRALPKVELHVHLEGTFSPGAIAAMAAAAGVALPRPPEHLFEFEDLSAFLAFLDWTCGLISTPERAADAAYAYAQRAAADGIVYAEVIVNPTHWSGWDLGALVEALTAGFDRAVADGLAECNLLLSILRQQTEAAAVALVGWMAKHRPRRVLGLSIDGDEARAGRTGPRFAPAYRLAAEHGFGRTAHAGESSGPDGVRDALDLLGVQRIDHGVRAIDDPELVARLAAEGVTLDVCVSSNLVHLYPSLADHPIAELLAAGVPVTLNTDDPGYLGIDLTGELATVAAALSWTVDDAVAVTRRAIAAAFCPPETAARLHTRLDEFAATASAPPPNPNRRTS